MGIERLDERQNNQLLKTPKTSLICTTVIVYNPTFINVTIRFTK